MDHRRSVELLPSQQGRYRDHSGNDNSVDVYHEGIINWSDVYQAGNGNNLDVTQIGTGNYSYISQAGDGGNANVYQDNTP